MTITSTIGVLAFLLGMVACLPPTWRVWRRQSAQDYAWLGLVMSLTCMTVTEAYLALLGNWLALGLQAIGYAACLVITAVKWRTERCETASEPGGDPAPGQAPEAPQVPSDMDTREN